MGVNGKNIEKARSVAYPSDSLNFGRLFAISRRVSKFWCFDGTEDWPKINQQKYVASATVRFTEKYSTVE